jgi:hypothetical protein
MSPYPTLVAPDVELWATGYLRAALPVAGLTGVQVGRVRSPASREVIIRQDGGQQLDPVRQVCRLGVTAYSEGDTFVDCSALIRISLAILSASAGSGPVVFAKHAGGPFALADESVTPSMYGVIELIVRRYPI